MSDERVERIKRAVEEAHLLTFEGDTIGIRRELSEARAAIAALDEEPTLEAVASLIMDDHELFVWRNGDEFVALIAPDEAPGEVLEGSPHGTVLGAIRAAVQHAKEQG